ncbi:ShlB/FhaC/HecB family hemolysin secretion/activation protein [Comamonas sp. GB3 AK4-5]|uniref:ShlB/FhaC/HecB family hemolysin secretion/activation protein n=1 Tax=Comamonas sp. GB3 AK4-5 TaxID=3231487 RepID=UPI00351F723F
MGLLLPAEAQHVRPPDAGRLLQENRPAPAPPAAAPALPEAFKDERKADGAPTAGPRVVLREVRVQEVLGVDMVRLRAATGLDQVIGQSLDLNGLRALAQQVTHYLQDQGYLVARAWLPEQDLSSGVLQINVLEGRYGQVLAQSSDNAVVASAQRWLASMQPGQAVTQAQLHRSLLLLTDLPGLSTRSVLRPGANVGEADLLLEAEPTDRWKGQVALDNYGNRYSGRERLSAGLEFQPGLVFGDQASIDVLGTREKTWQAAASYSLPLGVDGWRLQTQLSRTDYQLGKEFSALDAHGTADTFFLGASYPLLRTQNANIRTSAGWQYRTLRDHRDALHSSERKNVKAVVLSLSGDLIEPHAVSWGSMTLHAGDLKLRDDQLEIDHLTARTAGRYNRLNLDAARIQSVVSNWSVYGRVSAQWANKNLDGSEKMTLGGSTGVRGWPTGEAIGDRGWLAQLELRWQLAPAWQPYVFVDAGSVHLNKSPWSQGHNTRSIAGRGLGVRYDAKPVKLDLAVARRNGSAASQSEPDADRTRVWLSASYQF